MSDKKVASKINFEEGLKELENLVADLESEQFSLDDSLKKFETGVKLFKNCKDKLDKAEKKISQLNESLKEESL
ncbi:MAG: exodeoxyribonuclease VII small subunit [Bacteriovoracaceae bacterium]|nr:exodeoxyribonuclease VII small subunit [Bacteriovoracaceae bacterium]